MEASNYRGLKGETIDNNKLEDSVVHETSDDARNACR